MRFSTTARDIHAAIDAAWLSQVPECPECGRAVTESVCYDCSASDYLDDDFEPAS
jgi:hypothetical protein